MWQCLGHKKQCTPPPLSGSHQRASCRASVFWRTFRSLMILLLQTVYSPREHVVAWNEGHVLAGLKVGHYTEKRKANPSPPKTPPSGFQFFSFFPSAFSPPPP